MNESCASCAYRVGGECRRFPPQNTVIDETVGSTFPEVSLDEVCGEYAKTDSANPPASLRRSVGCLADASSHVKALS